MNILVAEDGQTSALALRLILERLGHEVTLATTGAEAWELLQAADWRVLITDWMMPGLEGPELCRRLRARAGRPYTYVILLTVRGSRADRLAGLSAGADDFLTKPVDPEELAVRLEVAGRILSVQDELMAVRDELARQNAWLSEIALTDHLTGALNRRGFVATLRAAASFARRYETPLSLAMIDIDHFKSYNDSFGHPAGDAALRAVAEILQQGVREHDAVARYGGEEFALLLPATEARAAGILAERLRGRIAGHDWPLRPVTASFGLATATGRQVDAQALVEQADRALYRSKEAGRNRVTHADGPDGAGDTGRPG